MPPLPPSLPHRQHCALRRAEAVADIENALDAARGDTTDARRLIAERRLRQPTAAWRAVEAKLAEAGRRG